MYRSIAVVVGALLLAGQSLAADPPGKAQDKDTGFPDLVGALKASPGCLGVETAETGSGKQVIFAWFEDKKAALAWVNSDTHRKLMDRFFPGARQIRTPLAGIPDDSGPIMAIASITLTEKPTKEKPLPFKQIAIELYQPLTGGLSIGGKFAPDKLKVPKRKEEPRK